MISFNVQIRDFPFDGTSQGRIESWKSENREYGSNWPVVYMIHNDDAREAYIGETLNAGKRAAQHWLVNERKRLKTIHIMTDDTFNKSVILDLESFLIKYVSADGKYELQNGNSGLSNFDYYSRNEYEQQFLKIWEKLKELGLVRKGIKDIEDSDFFKYSPYKSLTKDQGVVLDKILYFLTGYLKKGLECTLLVEGGAGTGKTIMAVYLLKLLCDLKNNVYEKSDEIDSDDMEYDEIQELLKNRELKIGFIVPQQSLRETIKKVFRTIHGLPETLVYTPAEAAQKAKNVPFDLLVCDEAHRLRRREALSQYPAFDKVNQDMGWSSDTTELDWIIRSSRMQLLFYDESQSVRPSDIPRDMFRQILSGQSIQRLKLTSQLRCLGGDDYIQYIKEVLNVQGFGFNGDPGDTQHSGIMREETAEFNIPLPHGKFDDYTLEFYDDVDQMMDEINRLNSKYDLSCAVAGYAWKWITKNEPKNTELRDINIGKGYIWNRTYTDWINSDRLPYEIGCIHTVQGYDLNYVGVIFGPEIIYDPKTKRIEVVKKEYHDSLGKAVRDDYEALRTYILNIYATLLTRGIRGALVYVCDPNLREYLRPFFSKD